LSPAGNDYLAHATHADEIGSECRRILLAVLAEASAPLTQRQILAHWPEDSAKPDVGTICRALKRLLEQGLIQREGSGRKNDLYRYWLMEARSGSEGGFSES
jgi:Fe2+ or Zn2+ uptake regulation protein